MGTSAKGRKTHGHGGWRPGSGRKPELVAPHRAVVDIEGADYDRLRELATADGVSLSLLVRRAVRSYVRRRTSRRSS